MSAIDVYSHKHDELNRPVAKRPASAPRTAPVADPAPRRDDCILTSRDYTLLEAWLIRAAESELEIDPVLIALVRAKLAAARIVLSQDLEPDRARGGSRVLYALDGSPPVEQLLGHWRPDAVTENILPITSILGICLLGMKARQRVPLVRSDGSLAGVWLEAVIPHTGVARADRQPTADRPVEGEHAEPEPAPAAPDECVGERILPFPRRKTGRGSSGGGRPIGPDRPDPGPAAA